MHPGPHPIFSGGPQQGQQMMLPSGVPHMGPHMVPIPGHPHSSHLHSIMPEHPVPGSAPCGVPPGGLNLDYKFCEINKRLAQRPNNPDNIWWDEFVREFFDENAVLTVSFRQEDGPRRYTIGRTLIPRYFRSIFEGGVTELVYVLRINHEFVNQSVGTYALDSEQTTVYTTFGDPLFIDVQTVGRLICEFGCDDMRIRHWNFLINEHRESVPKNIIAIHGQDSGSLEQMSKNVTFQGLSKNHLNYLRLCVILEPMQELMSRHKAFPSMSPRECLTTTLFQKWRSNVGMQPPGQQAPPIQQQMMMPPAEETAGRPTKRRKKRASTSGASTPTPAATGTGKKGKNATASPAPTAPQGFSLTTSQVDVMVVGEPSLMGGQFGEEDERLISRLENTQFDPNVATASISHLTGPNTDPLVFHNHGGNSGWLPPGTSSPLQPMSGNFNSSSMNNDVKPNLPPSLSSGGSVPSLPLTNGRPGSRNNSGGGERKGRKTDNSGAERPSQSPLSTQGGVSTLH